MYIVKLFFRALWEIVSIPLEAAAWVLFIVGSVFLLFVPVILVIAFLADPPSILEAAFIGYFGRRFLGRVSFRSLWKRVFLVFLAIVEFIAGFYLALLMVLYSPVLSVIPDSLHSLAALKVFYIVSAMGAVIFRRYVCDWPPMLIQGLKTHFANRRPAASVP